MTLDHTVAERLVGDVRLVMLGAGERTKDDFDAYLRESLKFERAVRATLLVVPPCAAGVSASERKALMRSGLLRKPTALMIDSLVARGILTALRWVGATSLIGFAVDDFAGACDFLSIAQSVRPRLLSEIAAMKLLMQGTHWTALR